MTAYHILCQNAVPYVHRASTDAFLLSTVFTVIPIVLHQKVLYAATACGPESLRRQHRRGPRSHRNARAREREVVTGDLSIERFELASYMPPCVLPLDV